MCGCKYRDFIKSQNNCACLMQKYNLNQSELGTESKKIDELMAKDKSFYQKVAELTAAKGCLPISQ